MTDPELVTYLFLFALCILWSSLGIEKKSLAFTVLGAFCWFILSAANMVFAATNQLYIVTWVYFGIGWIFLAISIVYAIDFMRFQRKKSEEGQTRYV